MILAVPSQYPPFPTVMLADRKYPAIDVSVLDKQPFVMITEGQFMQKALDNLAREQGLSLKKAAVVKSLEAQIAMVRAGVGMALVPHGIECFCAPSEVIFYSLQQPLPKREVVVMWKAERELNRVTEDLLRMMKEIVW